MDISMCLNKQCLQFQYCYRAQAIPSEYHQSYALFKPDENGKCDHYWAIKEVTNGK